MTWDDDERHHRHWIRPKALCQAKEEEALRDALLDVPLLIERVVENAAEADEQLAWSADDDVAQVRAALHACDHLLDGLELDAAVMTLLNRLATIDALRDGVRRCEPTPCLRSAWPLPDLASPILGRTLVCGGAVNDCVFDDDAALIMTADDSGAVVLWDTRTGDRFRELAPIRALDREPFGMNGATCCAFGPDRRVAVGYADGIVCIWHSDEGDEPLLVLDDGGPAVIRFADAGDDGLLARHHEAELRLWDWTTGRLRLAATGLPSPWSTILVAPFAVSHDSRRLVVGGGDGILGVWDLDTGARVGTLGGHRSEIVSVCAGGSWVASADLYGEVRTWDLDLGECRTVRKGARGPLERLAPHDRLVYADGLRKVAVRDPSLEAPTRRPLVRAVAPSVSSALRAVIPERLASAVGDRVGRTNGDIRCYGAPDGTWLVRIRNLTMYDGAISNDHVLTFCDPTTGALRKAERRPEKCVAAARSKDGTWLATVSDLGDVCVWDPSTATRLGEIEDVAPEPSALAVSSDSRLLAVASRRGSVRLLDMSAVTCAGGDPDTRAEDRTVDVAFDPRGRWVATLDTRRTVRVRDAMTGSVRHVLDSKVSGVFSNRELRLVCPDGRWVAAAADDGTVEVWDPETGRNMAHLHRRESGTLLAGASNASVRWLAIGETDGNVTLWDPLESRRLRTLRGHADEACACAASADGRTLVTATNHGDVLIWDVTTGGRRCTLSPHELAPKLALDPRGRWLATAEGHGQVRLWDVRDGTLLDALGERARYVSAVAVTFDGVRLATAREDGVDVWDTGSGALVCTFEHASSATACAYDPVGALAGGRGRRGHAGPLGAELLEAMLRAPCRWLALDVRLANGDAHRRRR